MIELFAFFLSLMLGWILLSALYWYAGRPVLQDAILYRIFAKRDELRMLAIEGQVDSETFAYQFLETRLCNIAYAADGITIPNFLRFLAGERSKETPPALRQFNDTAPGSLLTIWSEVADESKLLMIANSPILTAIALLFVPVLVARRGFQRVFQMFLRSVHRIDSRMKNFFEFEMTTEPREEVRGAA